MRDIDNILLIIIGFVAASCFFGAALYLMSMSNQIKYPNSKNVEAVTDPDTIEQPDFIDDGKLAASPVQPLINAALGIIEDIKQ